MMAKKIKPVHLIVKPAKRKIFRAVEEIQYITFKGISTNSSLKKVEDRSHGVMHSTFSNQSVKKAKQTKIDNNFQQWTSKK
jgi:hypothetical protein